LVGALPGVGFARALPEVVEIWFADDRWVVDLRSPWIFELIQAVGKVMRVSRSAGEKEIFAPSGGN
jgi:hypothetical protein